MAASPRGLRKRGDGMSDFEIIMIILTFASLVVSVIKLSK